MNRSARRHRVSRTARVLGSVAAASARRRATTLAVVAVVMLVLGAGVLQLEFRDNPLDAMPKDNPHTEASEALLDTFPGASFTGAVFVEVAPEKWSDGNDRLPNRLPFSDPQADEGQDQAQGAVNQILRDGSMGQNPGLADGYPGPHNITDEVYMRGMEELFGFLQSEIPELRWGITLPSQVKLVNYTNTGVPNPVPGGEPLRFPEEEAFSMPGTDPRGAQQFNSAWQTYYAASLDSIKSIVSQDWRTSRFGLLFEPGDRSLNEVGSDLYAAVEAYRDEVRRCDGVEGYDGPCILTWNVFEADGVMVDPRAPQAAAAYLTETTLEDLLRLGPFVAGFILASLFLAFRRVGTVAAMMLPMGLAGIGVLGVFGLIELPIHSVSLLVFPILMGNGIDFAIHMASAYNQARVDGEGPIDAARRAGEHAGTPLFVATLTTLAGMMLLVFSPNTLLTQLGLSIMLGMGLLLAVSLTALPATLTWSRPREVGRSALGDFLGRNARFWRRNRVLAGGTVAAVAAAGLIAAPALGTLILGTPAAFFPTDDPQRMDFEESNEEYYLGNEDLVTNSLVLRGDLTAPANMDLLRRLEQDVGALDYVRSESAVSIHFALNAWIQVRGGTAGAPLVIAQETAEPGSTFPQTQAEIRALLDEMFATPLATYATFFVEHDGQEPDYQIGNLLVEIHQPDRFEDLEVLWNDLLQTVRTAQEETEGSDLQIHLAGGTSVGYLFTKEELPYLQVAGILGVVMTGALVLVVRRSLRDAVTVTAVVASSTLAWLATLWLLDIPLSITLVVPVVMIAAIGSDYALHLRYGLTDRGSAAWNTVGRAVVYSALTDIGAFLIFTRMRYGILADATLATAMALAATLLMTLLLVPALTRDPEPRGHPRSALSEATP